MLAFMNPLFATDAYKLSHRGFMVPNTTEIYSNGTPRNAKYLPVNKEDHDGKILWFGLQGTMQELVDSFNDNFFTRPKEIAIAELKFIFDCFLGPNAVDTKHFEQLHDLGYLPIRVKRIREGKRVPMKVPVFTIRNTHKDFAWLTNFLETVLSAETWKATTVATIIAEYRKLINRFAMETVGHTMGTEFQIHDFSYRGMGNTHDAAKCGTGFLLSSRGTDTVPALIYASRVYGANLDTDFVGTSVPACYDSETEVLTSVGFIKFVDLTTDHLVAQYHTDGSIDFVKPTAYYNMPHSGEMIKWGTSGIDNVDMLVTPNHKMVRRSSKDNALSLFEAGDFSYQLRKGYSNRYKLPVSGNLIGNEHNLSALDKLRIAFQADGSLPSRPDAYISGQVRFNLKKSRKVDRLRSILRDLGVDYTETFQETEGYTDFWVNPHNKIFLEKNFNWVDLSTKSASWCAEFIEELSLWDGCKKNNCIVYSTTSLACAEKLQALAALCGQKAKWNTYQDARVNRQLIYTLTFSTRESLDGRAITREVTSYKGTVHCVSVPTKMLVVRRNNKVAVCGNTEHSLASAGIAVEGELETIRRWVTKDYPTGIVSVISDTLDFFKVVTKYATALREDILNRQPNTLGLAKVVFRPDSGKPQHIIAGYRIDPVAYATESGFYKVTDYSQYKYEVAQVAGKYFTVTTNIDGRMGLGRELSEAEAIGAVECLAEVFGTTITAKGYKQLHERVGLIYGDSITLAIAKDTLQRLKEKGYASTNVVFGVGSFTCQYLTRDSMGFAVKATSTVVNGERFALSKDPATDDGTKKSAKGLLRVDLVDGEFVLTDNCTEDQEAGGELELLFEDGKFYNTQEFAEIRADAETYFAS